MAARGDAGISAGLGDALERHVVGYLDRPFVVLLQRDSTDETGAPAWQQPAIRTTGVMAAWSGTMPTTSKGQEAYDPTLDRTRSADPAAVRQRRPASRATGRLGCSCRCASSSGRRRLRPAVGCRARRAPRSGWPRCSGLPRGRRDARARRARQRADQPPDGTPEAARRQRDVTCRRRRGPIGHPAFASHAVPVHPSSP